MPSLRPHPRAHENTGEKPAVQPTSKPLGLPAPTESSPPQGNPSSGQQKPAANKGRIPVGTKLEPAELAALDRLVKRLSGEQPATRSFALRWLVRQHCK